MPKICVTIPPNGDNTVYLDGFRIFARCGHICIGDEEKLFDIEKNSKTEKFLLRYLEQNPRFMGLDKTT